MGLYTNFTVWMHYINRINLCNLGNSEMLMEPSSGDLLKINVMIGASFSAKLFAISVVIGSSSHVLLGVLNCYQFPSVSNRNFRKRFKLDSQKNTILWVEVVNPRCRRTDCFNLIPERMNSGIFQRSSHPGLAISSYDPSDRRVCSIIS